MLILDEPTAVLTPQEAEVLFDTCARWPPRAAVVIFISHKLDEVAAVADRVTVLREWALGGDRRGGRRDAAVAGDAHGGTGGGARTARAPLAHQAEVVLDVRSLDVDDDRGRPAVRGRSLQVCGGEIVAIAAVAGNGQRELVEAIAGLRPASSGEVVGRRTRAPLGRFRASLAGRRRRPRP